MLQYLKNNGLSPPNNFNKNPKIIKKLDKKDNYLKVNIMTQSGEVCIKSIFLYVTIIKTGLTKSILKLLFLLKKVIKSHNLATVAQCYTMTTNILLGEALKILEYKDW